MAKRKTTEEFIADARKVHGDKYTYSKVVYINTATKVLIICDCGNEFLQRPNSHLRGDGCPRCGDKARVLSCTHTTERYIEKARVVHGNLYDYSLVNYIHNTQCVDIICCIHGVFSQGAGSHLEGHGCPSCAQDKINAILTNSHSEFLERSKIAHGDRYNYSLAEYIGADIKVKIICPKHGVFEQSPHLHMRGHGCRLCYNESIAGENNPLYKHGKSAEIFSERDSPENRQWARKVKAGVSSCDYCEEAFEEWNTAQAHHKNSWRSFPEQRYDLENGVVLCKSCHDLFHGIYGKGGNTEEQYKQFKKLSNILM